MVGNILQYSFFLLLISLGTVFQVHANEKYDYNFDHSYDEIGKALTFNMTHGGYPPFMIQESEKSKPSGIMYDVVNHIFTKLGYSVETVQLPKKREIQFFEFGHIDAHAMAKEWVSRPGDYVFSLPIIKVRNLLFSNVETPVVFNTFDDLIGKRAITHLGYVYPPLTNYFSDNKVERINTISEKSMLRMVLYGRGDFAIVNEFVGSWLIKENGWQNKFIISKKEVTNYDYRIMFSKKWKPLVTKFNQELELMKKDGSLEAIISKYTKTISIK